MTRTYRTLRVALAGAGVLSVVLDVPPMNLTGPELLHADTRRFRQLVVSDAAQARTAALFAQDLQTRGPLELDLGDRLGTL